MQITVIERTVEKTKYKEHMQELKTEQILGYKHDTEKQSRQD